MTDKQPDALRLADWLDTHCNGALDNRRKAAALLRTQHAEIESLKTHLRFVERWANHHGAKPHFSPKEVLSVIQHYPPITRITHGYADGVVPDTFDPYAAIERKDALLRQALEVLEFDMGKFAFSAYYAAREGTVLSIKQELSQ